MAFHCRFIIHNAKLYFPYTATETYFYVDMIAEFGQRSYLYVITFR